VIVPTAPLPPGARTLTLSEKLPDGTSVDAAGSVLAVVPGVPTGGTPTVAGAVPATPPLAVLDQPGAAPRVLQAPPGGKTAGLGLAAVDYDEHGQMRFAGNAPASAPVRLYVDNHPLGDATADAQGRWTLSPSAEIVPGPHRLRVDQLDRNGRVVSRIELPFLREQLPAELIGDSRVVVQPGESLWRIARRSYGMGVRYTVIYQANQSQIRDPRRIYPGQLLTVPPEGGKQTQ
jgi:nucleoid-associated protein YgaU